MRRLDARIGKTVLVCLLFTTCIVAFLFCASRHYHIPGFSLLKKQSTHTKMEKIADLSKEELLELISEALLSKKTESKNNNEFSSASSSVQNDENHNNTDTDQYIPDVKSPNRDLECEETQVKIEPNDSIEAIYIKSVKSPTIHVCSSTSSPVKVLKSFQIPMNTITDKLEDVQKLVHLLGNTDNNQSLQRFYSSLYSMIDDYNLELLKRKDLMNNDFIKSLETITKIFQITSKFSPIENINESVLTPTIRKMIMDYNSNIFKSLESYCINNETSMLLLNNDIEENLIRLIPVLSNQLLTFSKQLKKFYSLYESVDDYTLIDQTFLETLPTKNDINLFNEINKATDIKVILQTNFNKINPYLIDQLNNEISNLDDYITLKVRSLKELIQSVLDINHRLFKPNEEGFMAVPNLLNNKDLILSKYGIKSKVFNNYEDKLQDLSDIESQRRVLLDDYMTKTEQLWSILRPNSTEIQSFLKANQNLYTQSLNNFKRLLNELEVEKLKNIKKFILSTRDQIEGFWSVLMYDEESKHNFQDFFITDPTRFDESLLKSHSKELERLRNESDSIRPLLMLISQLDELINEKLELEKSLKDPSRLLKRNSFQVLKQEEKTQRRLQKQFPKIIDEIKLKIEEFQTLHKREFKLNREPYLQSLEEIENRFLFSKRKTFRSAPSSLQRKKTVSKASKSGVQIKKNFVTPSRSIIRKLDPDQMTNPFLSHEPTPLKVDKKTPNSVLGSKFSFSSPSSLLLDKRSPLRLNLNASTKIISLSSSGAKRKPMGILSTAYRNNDNISNRPSPFKLPTNSIQQLNSVAVEELSDSILDYSDTEPLNNNKENIHTPNNELSIHKGGFSLLTTIETNKQVPNTQHFNLSLDSETF